VGWLPWAIILGTKKPGEASAFTPTHPNLSRKTNLADVELDKTLAADFIRMVQLHDLHVGSEGDFDDADKFVSAQQGAEDQEGKTLLAHAATQTPTQEQMDHALSPPWSCTRWMLQSQVEPGCEPHGPEPCSAFEFHWRCP
jgi:hypothetical protein